MNLTIEVQLLYRAEAQFNLPAAPVIRYLAAELSRPLPDVLPEKPQPIQFQWPRSGVVDYRDEWARVDREAARS